MKRSVTSIIRIWRQDHQGESILPGAGSGKDTRAEIRSRQKYSRRNGSGQARAESVIGAGPFHGSRQGTAVQTGRPAQMGQIKAAGQAPQRSDGLNGSYRSPAGTGSVKPEGTKNHTGKTVLITAVTGLLCSCRDSVCKCGGPSARFHQGIRGNDRGI